MTTVTAMLFPVLPGLVVKNLTLGFTESLMVEPREEQLGAAETRTDPAQESAFGESDDDEQEISNLLPLFARPSEKPPWFGEALVSSSVLHLHGLYSERVSCEFSIYAIGQCRVGGAMLDEKI
jgi:hypothetical protein